MTLRRALASVAIATAAVVPAAVLSAPAHAVSNCTVVYVNGNPQVVCVPG
jgi:hypothetical protein